MATKNKKTHFIRNTILFFCIIAFILFTYNSIAINRLQSDINSSPHQEIQTHQQTILPNLKNAKTAILILTHSRPEYLQQTISSLVQLKGTNEISLYISQDGKHEGVATMITKMKPLLENKFLKFQKLQFSLPYRVAASSRIAQHYKFALDVLFSQHKQVIILEDDMVVSPDFLYYFEQTSFLLDDPEILCISSWNDFGYPHLVNDTRRLFLTQFFPGLGWMLNRKTWEKLSPNWPLDLWDDWMRVHMGSRSCVVPEVSRNKNIGEKGVHFSVNEHRIKVGSVAFNTKKDVQFGDLGYLKRYKEYMKNIVRSGKILPLDYVDKLPDEKGKIFVIPFTRENLPKLFKKFQIPFLELRCHYQDTLILKYEGNTIVLANVRKSPFLPSKIRQYQNPELQIIAGPVGMNCDRACKQHNLHCDETQFDYLNNCEMLKESFPCKGIFSIPRVFTICRMQTTVWK